MFDTLEEPPIIVLVPGPLTLIPIALAKVCECEAIWAVVKVVLPVEPEMFPVSSFTS